MADDTSSTERGRESPHDGDAGEATAETGAATGYPVAQLLERRDMMLREVRAMENKVAGIDMALAILNDAAPITGE